MSKKIRHKTATFQLAADGFSIHTFELWRQLNRKQYQEIREYLYSLNVPGEETCTYPNNWSNIVCSAFSAYGLGITLEDSREKDDKYKSYSLRVFVSPRRLLDPGTSYLGILKPNEKSVDRLTDAFHKLFKGTPIPGNMAHYTVTQADLCTNIRCNHGKLFREMVRVIHKLPTPPKYERKFRKQKTAGLNEKKKKEIRKKDNQYNKHYFKVACDSCDLVIYDKGYQITAEGLETIGYEKLPSSVLRFERRLKRCILRDIESEIGTGGSDDLLKYLISNSAVLLIEGFSRYFTEDPFCRMDEIERQVEGSAYARSVSIIGVGATLFCDISEDPEMAQCHQLNPPNR